MIDFGIKIKEIGVAVSVVLLTLYMSSCVTDNDPEYQGVSVGDAIPYFSVTLNDGMTISSSSLNGRVAVIEFFNTSCHDCQKSFPVLQQVYEYFSDDDRVVVFAIARDESEEFISEYWMTNALTVPYSPQNGRDVYEKFANVGIPRIYIVSVRGVISSAFGPDDTPSFQTILKGVEEAESDK